MIRYGYLIINLEIHIIRMLPLKPGMTKYSFRLTFPLVSMYHKSKVLRVAENVHKVRTNKRLHFVRHITDKQEAKTYSVSHI